MQIYAAEWVLPVSSQPIKDGAVVVKVRSKEAD